jgi:hypothetical protein
LGTVGEGRIQKVGIDFDELFAPEVRVDSEVISMVYRMDMNSAFLNGQSRVVCMDSNIDRNPLVIVKTDKTDSVCFFWFIENQSVTIKKNSKIKN